MKDIFATRAGNRLILLATWASALLVGPLWPACGGAGVADPWKGTARYKFEYRVDFAAVSAPATTDFRIWVPYPKDTKYQRVLAAAIDFPWPHSIETDRLGNRMVYAQGKGVPNADLVMRFEIERDPSDGIPADEALSDSPSDPDLFLGPARLVPLGGVIGKLAARQARGASTDGEKIRAFYDYVVKTMRYSKSGSGSGRGDAIWACDHKRGNCTDFHSLLIGMARSQEIPARFIIGFPIPQDAGSGPIAGYHCWAELFERGRGWLPVDASEAARSGRPEAYFGRIPNDRIEFTTGRDLSLAPPQSGPPLNYFIYPYAEADGAALPQEKLKATFRFERIADPGERPAAGGPIDPGTGKFARSGRD